jgi:hypothetical protein
MKNFFSLKVLTYFFMKYRLGSYLKMERNISMEREVLGRI